MVIFIVISLSLFYGFVFYAGCIQAWNRLLIGAKILLLPPVLIFGIVDILFNSTFGTIMFLEFPTLHLITFSKRCEYHMHEANWRGSIAGAYCFLLNCIIPGHCE
jgi:hypothetical protein